jgi:hypothetical protein
MLLPLSVSFHPLELGALKKGSRISERQKIAPPRLPSAQKKKGEKERNGIYKEMKNLQSCDLSTKTCDRCA